MTSGVRRFWKVLGTLLLVAAAVLVAQSLVLIFGWFFLLGLGL